LILAALVGSAGVLWYTWRPEPEPPKPKAVEQKPAAEEPAEISLSGRLQSLKIVNVKAPVEGILESVQVREGDEVTEGQLLANVKNEPLEAEQRNTGQEVEQVQARLNAQESGLISARLEAQRIAVEASTLRNAAEAARKTYERESMLWKEGATPRKRWEKSEADWKNATVEAEAKETLARQARDRVDTLTRGIDESRKALLDKTQDWEEAKAGLNATQIHSPVDGMITKLVRNSGDPVDPNGSEVFQVAADLTLMEAVVQLNSEELKRVKPGQPALVILVEAGPDPIAAQVREIKGSEAFLEFKSPNPAIKPGQIAQVRIQLKPSDSKPPDSKPPDSKQ
jgi:multidrug resistance efflux pump